MIAFGVLFCMLTNPCINEEDFKMSNVIQKMRATLLEKDDMLEREEIPCSEEESAHYRKLLMANGILPDGVFTRTDESGVTTFYTWVEPTMTDEDWREYLAIRQYEELRTIRKCAVLLAILASCAAAFGLWIIICSIFS